MFKHLNTTLIALGCIFTLTGCIQKDYPPCDPLKINLVVADKNYSNVLDIEEEETMDENLPFHSYVPTVCYAMRNADTGEIVSRSGIVPTTTKDLNHCIQFPADLPHGNYEIVVWGGIKSMAALDFDDSPATAAFHTTDDGDEDIYLGHANLYYGPFDTDVELQMKRTMGKLIVVKELVGKAEGVTRTQKVITELRHHVDRELNYEGSNDVVFNNTFEASPEIITKTVVAPSVSDAKTRFHIEFFNDVPHTRYPVLIPEDIRINIRPNQITVLRYVYNPEVEKFDIYVKNHNAWESVIDLDLKD